MAVTLISPLIQADVKNVWFKVNSVDNEAIEY